MCTEVTKHVPDDPHPPWCLKLFRVCIAYFRKYARPQSFAFVPLTWWIVFWVLRSFKINQIFLSLQLEWFGSQSYALHSFPLAAFHFIIFKILYNIVHLCYYFPWAQRCHSRQNSFLNWVSVTRNLHVFCSCLGLIIFTIPAVTNNSVS